MYKYNCRKCPVRSRCISESDNSPGAKVMIRHAFEARTDTLSTWAMLQKNCLLVKAESERSKSALTDRLQQLRESKDEPPSSQLGKAEQAKKPVRPLRSLSKPAPRAQGDAVRTEKPVESPDYLKPVSPPTKRLPTRPLRPLASARKTPDTDTEFYWLIVDGTMRRIALPTSGELSLGRFDPNLGIPPDIDLTYEDRRAHLVSRRHATISGRDGEHTIEDLGSKSGVFINGERVKGLSRRLKRGDRVQLGGVLLLYDKVPASVLERAKSAGVRHMLSVTATGRKLAIVPDHDILIGRADPQINYIPDIDLSQEGDVAQLVSRHHARIQWRSGQPYLEDEGSGFGTRLRGELLLLGQAVPLRPGDHIWVAGCVLAYDIELL